MPTRHPEGRLKDKIAIVTGAASGIGRQIALFYAAEGATVAVGDLREASKTPGETDVTTVDKIKATGGESIFVQTDVTSSDSVDALVKAVVAKYGRLDIMVNNAGIAPDYTAPGSIWELRNSDWDKLMAINANGVFYGTRAASAQMITQDPRENGDRGWIVNLASIFGLVGVPGACSYVASKHLVMGLTKSASLDLAPHRVHCNAICPGYVQSALTEHIWKDEGLTAAIKTAHPFRGLGEPEDIARIAVFLASDDARWVQGTGIVADGGYTAQ